MLIKGISVSMLFIYINKSYNDILDRVRVIMLLENFVNVPTVMS
jgi:hypothetical protein